MKPRERGVREVKLRPRVVGVTDIVRAGGGDNHAARDDTEAYSDTPTDPLPSPPGPSSSPRLTLTRPKTLAISPFSPRLSSLPCRSPCQTPLPEPCFTPLPPPSVTLFSSPPPVPSLYRNTLRHANFKFLLLSVLALAQWHSPAPSFHLPLAPRTPPAPLVKKWNKKTNK